jgi:putative thioredoxin
MSDLVIDPNQPQASNGVTPALDLGPGAAPSSASANDWITNSDTPHFMADVIEASQATPVIVNFWSPRSEASQAMTPVMEKLVRRAGGLVKLVNMEAEKNPALVKQLHIQGVPTVFAFKEGRPVDAFAGVQSEGQLSSFIDKLIGDAQPPIEAAMEQAAELLAAGDGVQAEAIYTAVLTQDDTFMPALAGLIRAIAEQGDFARAAEIIDALDAKTRVNVDVAQAMSALELAKQSATVDTGASAALQAQVDANPKDLQARFDLAQALFAQGQTEAAIEHLLEIVRLDRAWNEAAGRKQLIKIFDALGSADPLTQDARRRLSAVLFS